MTVAADPLVYGVFGGLYAVLLALLVFPSGIAGTMSANGSGLQWATIRNIAMAWVLTLPAAMVISGTLYYVFSHLF